MSKKYLIDKATYERLKTYCRGYSTWVEEYQELQDGKVFSGLHKLERSPVFSDPTCNRGILMAERSYKINLVDEIIREVADIPEFQNCLRLAITEGVTYRYMSLRMGLKIDKDTFFNAYRKFFWILSKKKLNY